MCEVMTALAIASTLVTGYVTSENQKHQGEFNAQVAENNAALARASADDANALGTRESERQAWRTRMQIGQQRAAIAAAGIDSQTGTPAEILGETALFGEIEQQDIRLNAARAAWGHQVDASNFGTAAGLSRWEGDTASRMTILGSLGSAAITGANAYGGSTRPARSARVGRSTAATINTGAGLGGWS